MFTSFVLSLRQAGVPVSVTEYLALLGAVQAGTADCSVEDFYFLSRAALVKDERLLDRFDRVFAACFKGLDDATTASPDDGVGDEIPAEWLRRMTERLLTREEQAQIEAAGGLNKLMDMLRERLKEQKSRHQGGSKWIGTAGTSPFGAYGYNPEGVRIGQDGNRQRRAVKVWDKREFRDLDDTVELGTRNVKLALRRLRRFARSGLPTELDLAGTISATAANAGSLDLRMQAERHNAVRVLLFLDVGGSMDEHVKVSAELFSAARSEFKQINFFYYHNCPYERVWTGNRRRHDNTVATTELLRTYGPEFCAIFAGDATMSPYEIVTPGGSVEHWNDETGATWLKRMTEHWRRSAWLNPVPEMDWSHVQSIGVIRSLLERRMFPCRSRE